MSALAWTPAPKPTDYRFVDLTGDAYGRITVLAFAGRDARQKHVWRCRCACGAETFARADHLRSGRITSCGCARDDGTAALNRTHGAAGTIEHRVWKGMRERCERPRPGSSWDRYGARGIVVCERWADFANFLADMGPRPSAQHSVERLDNDGPYAPENCVWALPKQQSRNRRDNRLVEVSGRRVTLAEAEEITGIDQHTICQRLRRGWTEHQAVSVPARSGAPA